MKYTVDRIEQDLVVLLEKGNETNQKDVPIHRFPEGIKDGAIVQEDGDRYIILQEETEAARFRAKALLKKIIDKNK